MWINCYVITAVSCCCIIGVIKCQSVKPSLNFNKQISSVVRSGFYQKVFYQLLSTEVSNIKS
jgi:hypothetical protein